MRGGSPSLGTSETHRGFTQLGCTLFVVKMTKVFTTLSTGVMFAATFTQYWSVFVTWFHYLQIFTLIST